MPGLYAGGIGSGSEIRLLKGLPVTWTVTASAPPPARASFGKSIFATLVTTATQTAQLAMRLIRHPPRYDSAWSFAHSTWPVKLDYNPARQVSPSDQAEDI